MVIHTGIENVLLETLRLSQSLAGLFRDKDLSTSESTRVCLSSVWDPQCEEFLANVAISEDFATQFSKDCSLSRDEISILTLFCIDFVEVRRSLHSIVNEALNSNDKEAIKPLVNLIWTVMHALKKCPVEKSKKLYRFARNDISGLYEVGITYTWRQFAFCSTTDPRSLHDEQIQTIFQIESLTSRCRNVSKFSLSYDVPEALFPPNSRFKVLRKAVEVSSTGRSVVVVDLLEQLPNDPILRFGNCLQGSIIAAMADEGADDDLRGSGVLYDLELSDSKEPTPVGPGSSRVADVAASSSGSVARVQQWSSGSSLSLQRWMVETAGLTTRRASEYSLILEDLGIANLGRLSLVISRHEDYLLQIGFDADDANDVLRAMGLFHPEASRSFPSPSPEPMSADTRATPTPPLLEASTAAGKADVATGDSQKAASSTTIKDNIRYHTGCYVVSRSRGFKRWNCCLVRDKHSLGCKTGVPKHHPGRREISPLESSFRRLTGVSNERWWMCCWNADRSIDGCRLGLHPDPFP